TKLINNSYVSNPDKLLSDQTVVEINLLLDSLEKKTSAQVAVVMLNSIGDEDIFEFAQSLFMKWGVGKSNNDNGLLILFVQDKKTVRFHTGYGLEGVLPDAICERIQTQKMVPFFKDGNIDAGMKAGVEEVAKIIANPNYAEEIQEDTSASEELVPGDVSILMVFGWFVIGIIVFLFKRKGFSNAKNFSSDVPHHKMSSWQWLLWCYVVPLALFFFLIANPSWLVFFAAVYGYIALLGLTKYARISKEANRWLEKKEYHAVHHFLSDQKKGILAMAIFFPLPFIFIHAFLKRKIGMIRTKPRDCKNCGQQTHRLDETAEDEYLSKESQFEETIKSVDYDVWKCHACGEISLEAYINEKTEYSECPKCKTYAFYTSSTTTKVAATTSRSGEREVVKTCKYCNHQLASTETIPMIVVSSSSGSSSSSSGSSGGSWGGGSSGGGGASSSW
ncbi:MAG: hypothetical protein RI909_2245, partial [Bacteroidota bacterium]